MDYEINTNTLALISQNEDNTKVLEDVSEYIVEKNAFEIVEHSCEYFGSTYEGRHSGTKNLIGVTHKAPIIIEEYYNIIFFPTSSPKNPECIWLSLNNILTYKVGSSLKTTLIEFKNGKKIEVPVSIGSLNNQILRATRLESVINSRKNKK